MPLPPSAADYLALDREQRANVLLDELATCHEGLRGRNLLNDIERRWFPELLGCAPVPVAGFEMLQAKRRAVRDALEEAYASLESGGDIRPDPSSGRTFCRVTEGGHDRLQTTTMPDSRRVLFARRALEHVQLHPALLAREINNLFRQGRYETALRDGSAYLEDTIRVLGDFQNSDFGAKLCGKAFSANGPLADPALGAGEQNGWQQLYTGFFGTVRNKVAHRDFKYTSDKQALSHLMQLDLLVEQLAATAARLGQSLP